MKKRILSALCALVLLFSCLVMPAGAQSSLTTDFSRLLIRDVLEGPYTLDNPPTDVTVLVVGRVICGRTLRAASETLALFEEMQVENGRIILLDIDQEEDAVREYALSNPGISAAWCDGTPDYQKLFWEIYRACPVVPSDEPVSLPSVCALNASLEPIYFSSNNTFTKEDMAEALIPYANVLPEPEPIPQPTPEPEPEAPPTEALFADVVPGDWYYDAVAYVQDAGLMGGTGEDRFSPQAPTTRAMMVTILYRLHGADTPLPFPFSDVPPGQWYSDAVAWAAIHGIVTGYSNGTFAPDGNITREQLATILFRYTAYRGAFSYDLIDLNAFTDADQISPYARDAMIWAVSEGLLTGTGSGELSPGGYATRAQLATILMRFCQ